MFATGSCWKPDYATQSDLCMVPQSNLIHPKRSTPFDMEKASADSVDLATQEIFFDIQDSGLMGALWFLSRSWFVAKNMAPWNEDNCLALAKDASPKLT